MEIGSIINNFDVAQVTLYAFWIFFAGLIIYLRREDKREGYPLDTELPERVEFHGFPRTPEPKTFLLEDGSKRKAPRPEQTREIAAEPTAPWMGAPLVPTGDPLRDGVGPASYALRDEVPDLNHDGKPKIMPMRLATKFSVVAEDRDPRGLNVIAADKKIAGMVTDIWVDRGEPQIRYLEVALKESVATRNVLLPIGFARFTGGPWQHHVKVKSLLAEQFAHVPSTKNPNEITRREEDQICAYYGGGHLYAHPLRQEPFL